jgi:hypothetical protein
MDYKAVERWTSKIDVFSYDYIVIPINEQYVVPQMLLLQLLMFTLDTIGISQSFAM